MTGASSNEHSQTAGMWKSRFRLDVTEQLTLVENSDDAEWGSNVEKNINKCVPLRCCQGKKKIKYIDQWKLARIHTYVATMYKHISIAVSAILMFIADLAHK